MKRSFVLDHKTLKHVCIRPRTRVRLRRHDPTWVRYAELGGLTAEKKEARRILQENILKLSQAQELLYASASHGVLIILQGMDGAGKDGTIKHVMSGVNPQGCQVHGYKQPSAEELKHDFLWRYGPAIPARGQISILNRSHYEEVLAVRVHPEWLERQHVSTKGKKYDVWAERFEDINSFERHLARNGIIVLKFFLHISKQEQRRRLLERLDDKSKLWKFSPSDLAERAYWKDYQSAYEEAISATSTAWAPWYVIPADHKWAARALIADIITSSVHGLKLRSPRPTLEVRRGLAGFRRSLERK